MNCLRESIDTEESLATTRRDMAFPTYISSHFLRPPLTRLGFDALSYALSAAATMVSCTICGESGLSVASSYKDLASEYPDHG